MGRREPHWDELRTFLEVARDLSLSGAARRLGLAQPSVGRHIDALEEALGATLFTRSPRGLSATAAAALARSASSAAAIDRGVVRVTASEIMSSEALPPILASFRARNPGVAVELAVSNRNQDLARGDADIAVRMVRPTQSGLVARRIGVTRIRLYAHRDYLARFGEPRSLADLKHHCLIGFDRDNRSFRSAGAPAQLLAREDFGFRCDSDLAQLAALRAGVGVGGCQDAVARRTPELVAVLTNAFQFTLEVWLVMHRDLKTAPRVRL